MHALAAGRGGAAAVRPFHSLAPPLAPRRRRRLVLLPPAPSSSKPGRSHQSSAPPPSSSPPAPSSVPTTPPPPTPPGAPSPPPSLFGMISSLWPGAGGAAQQRAARASAEARAASAVRPLASRLELEAELRACEAPGAPPLLVILSTSWCGPCKLLAEDLQEAAERRAAQRGGGGAGAVRIVKLDVEQREGGLAEVASALKVQKLPTLFVCGGRGAGKPALRTTGLLKRKVIDDLIDRSAFMGSDLGSAVLY